MYLGWDQLLIDIHVNSTLSGGIYHKSSIKPHGPCFWQVRFTAKRNPLAPTNFGEECK